MQQLLLVLFCNCWCALVNYPSFFFVVGKSWRNTKLECLCAVMEVQSKRSGQENMWKYEEVFSVRATQYQFMKFSEVLINLQWWILKLWMKPAKSIHQRWQIVCWIGHSTNILHALGKVNRLFREVPQRNKLSYMLKRIERFRSYCDMRWKMGLPQQSKQSNLMANW